MKNQQVQRNALPRWAVLAAMPLTAGAAACVSTVPYISKNVSNKVALQPSASHGFEYVHVGQDGKRLVVYGKVSHAHIHCETEGHVDVAVVNAGNEVVFKSSMPVVNRGRKRKGWYGAAFRARLPVVLTSGARVRLAFHDPKCINTSTYDCGKNAARTTNAENDQ